MNENSLFLLAGNAQAKWPIGLCEGEAIAKSSLQERLDRLYEWNFDRVIAKLVATKQAEDQSEALDMLNEYKRYVELHLRFNTHMPMSVRVDPAWHTHILFTRDYENFCQHVVGNFLHHEPTINDNEIALLRERYIGITLSNYERIFGPPPQKWWPQDAQICEPPGCRAGCGDAS